MLTDKEEQELIKEVMIDFDNEINICTQKCSIKYLGTDIWYFDDTFIVTERGLAADGILGEDCDIIVDSLYNEWETAILKYQHILKERFGYGQSLSVRRMSNEIRRLHELVAILMERVALLEG